MPNLYIGDITDAKNREAMQQNFIMFPIDVRTQFNKDMMPKDTVWNFAWGIIGILKWGSVMLHCHGGIDRSPFIASIVVKLHRGSNWDEAWEIVSKGRKQAIRHDDWEREAMKW